MSEPGNARELACRRSVTPARTPGLRGVGLAGAVCGVLLLTAFGGGCKKQEPLDLYARAEVMGQYVTIEVSTGMKPAKFELSGIAVDPKVIEGAWRPADDAPKSRGKYLFEGAELPAGPQTVTVTARETGGDQRVATKTVTFTREATDPEFEMTCENYEGPDADTFAFKTHSPTCKEASFSTKTGKYAITFKAPPKTKLEVVVQGKKKLPFSVMEPVSWTSTAASQTLTVTLDLLPSLWAVEGAGGYGVFLNVTATSEEGKAKSSRHQILVGNYLQQVKDGPVLAPGEQPDNGPARGLVRLGSFNETKMRVGQIKTLRDIHLVAFTKDVQRTKSCGTFRGKTSGMTKEIRNSALDRVVTVYDRRTGKKVVTKTFAAKMPGCPKSISSGYSGVKDTFPMEKVDAWLKTLIKG